MAEVIIWTVVFVGGDLVAVVALMTYAIRKDREKMRSGVHEEPDTT